MPEKEAVDHKCPDCKGKLNALLGVFGREVCRRCKQPVITNADDDKFDRREWKYLGDDANGNARYGTVDGNLRTADPRSTGSKTENSIIEVAISENGVGIYKEVK